MKIFSNTGGIAHTNAFLIGDETSKKAVLFDAPDHTVAPLLDAAQRDGYDVIGLWLTHGHFDHIADHALVTQKFPGAKILIHALDEPKLANPGAQSFPLPFVIPARKADGYLTDNQELMIGSIPLRILHTPGHCGGHVSFFFPREKILVGGDLIIMNAVGRTDLPDSEPDELDASIRRIVRQLPPETHLLPGHGKPSTLAQELQTNPFVQRAMQLGG